MAISPLAIEPPRHDSKQRNSKHESQPWEYPHGVVVHPRPRRLPCLIRHHGLRNTWERPCGGRSPVPYGPAIPKLECSDCREHVNRQRANGDRRSKSVGETINQVCRTRPEVRQRQWWNRAKGCGNSFDIRARRAARQSYRRNYRMWLTKSAVWLTTLPHCLRSIGAPRVRYKLCGESVAAPVDKIY